MPFTVIEVLRRLGVEPEPAVSWACGMAVRDAWVERHGALPHKGLRPKTNGHGSHCFALYPETAREFVVEVVQTTLTEIGSIAAAQGRLFP